VPPAVALLNYKRSWHTVADFFPNLQLFVDFLSRQEL